MTSSDKLDPQRAPDGLARSAASQVGAPHRAGMAEMTSSESKTWPLTRPAGIAYCPEHGLHGDRAECFVCGLPVQQITMVPLMLLEQFLSAVGGCREEMPNGDKCWAPAEFVIWGKLSAPQALGPRCYTHASKHVGDRALGDPAWAIVDLRPLREATTSSRSDSATVGEWRRIAEWDWVQVEPSVVLHAVATIENDADEEWYADGTTVCGIAGRMHIPGLFSRMGTKRCSACCEQTGMPQGAQSPKNVDECRPIVENRLAALEMGV